MAARFDEGLTQSQPSLGRKGQLALARIQAASSGSLARTGPHFKPGQVASIPLPKHLGLSPQRPCPHRGPRLPHLFIHALGLLRGQQKAFGASVDLEERRQFLQQGLTEEGEDVHSLKVLPSRGTVHGGEWRRRKRKSETGGIFRH